MAGSFGSASSSVQASSSSVSTRGEP
jgi:hypothetical protein